MRSLAISCHQHRNFPIEIHSRLFSGNGKRLLDLISDRKIIICWCGNIERLYGTQLRIFFANHLAPEQYHILVIFTSEQVKTLRCVEYICEEAQKFKLDRHGILLSIGGGILSDIVALTASIFRRGIDLIKINTTLVGQIDVGLGIKTGVNFHSAKNALGTFYPPLISINDPVFLTTLPVKQIRCGLAEMLKVALICDAHLFAQIEQFHESILGHKFNGPRGNADLPILYRTMEKMVDQLKDNIYEHDLERLVDFGHTFSYLIESSYDYKLEHGEAVAIDMIISAKIAVLLGLLSQNDYLRISMLFQAIGLPLYHAEACKFQAMNDALEYAFARRAGKVLLVVPTAIGKATFLRNRSELPETVLAQALAELARSITTGSSCQTDYSF